MTTPPDARNALAEIVAGVNVRILKEQCERLAAPIRASTRSFQFASALDNSVAVINELQDRIAALEAQAEGMRVALENLATVIKDNKRGVLHSLSRRETDILTQALHDARAALQSSETTGEK